MMDEKRKNDGRLSRDEERIGAYVDGEMTDEESAAFERLLTQDAGLRDAVAQWREAMDATRDWIEADPPGAERVSKLEIPLIAPAPKARVVEISFRTRMIRVAAAAAIFFVGISVGRLTTGGNSKPDFVRNDPPIKIAVTPVAIEVSETPVPPTTTPKAEEPAEDRTPTIVTPGGTGATKTVLASVAPPRRSTRQNGRMIVETTLRSNGAPIVWVVDGEFDLASANENRR